MTLMFGFVPHRFATALLIHTLTWLIPHHDLALARLGANCHTLNETLVIGSRKRYGRFRARAVRDWACTVNRVAFATETSNEHRVYT